MGFVGALFVRLTPASWSAWSSARAAADIIRRGPADRQPHGRPQPGAWHRTHAGCPVEAGGRRDEPAGPRDHAVRCGQRRSPGGRVDSVWPAVAGGRRAMREARAMAPGPACGRLRTVVSAPPGHAAREPGPGRVLLRDFAGRRERLRAAWRRGGAPAPARASQPHLAELASGLAAPLCIFHLQLRSCGRPAWGWGGTA